MEQIRDNYISNETSPIEAQEEKQTTENDEQLVGAEEDGSELNDEEQNANPLIDYQLA